MFTKWNSISMRLFSNSPPNGLSVVAAFFSVIYLCQNLSCTVLLNTSDSVDVVAIIFKGAIRMLTYIPCASCHKH